MNSPGLHEETAIIMNKVTANWIRFDKKYIIYFTETECYTRANIVKEKEAETEVGENCGLADFILQV